MNTKCAPDNLFSVMGQSMGKPWGSASVGLTCTPPPTTVLGDCWQWSEREDTLMRGDRERDGAGEHNVHTLLISFSQMRTKDWVKTLTLNGNYGQQQLSIRLWPRKFPFDHNTLNNTRSTTRTTHTTTPT